MCMSYCHVAVISIIGKRQYERVSFLACETLAQLQANDASLKQSFSTLQTYQEVADILEVPSPFLNNLLWGLGPARQYRTWAIKKRRGGHRRIDAPRKNLCILQRKLAYILNLVARIGAPAHGCVLGRSIVTNAKVHRNKRVLLSIDLRDFFPSINFGRVRGLFNSRPYKLGQDSSTALAQLCCYQNRLPQGAPTSPVVSNMICARLDAELVRFAKQYRCMYTRYVDDITFSSSRNKMPSVFGKKIRTIWISCCGRVAVNH